MATKASCHQTALHRCRIVFIIRNEVFPQHYFLLYLLLVMYLLSSVSVNTLNCDKITVTLTNSCDFLHHYNTIKISAFGNHTMFKSILWTYYYHGRFALFWGNLELLWWRSFFWKLSKKKRQLAFKVPNIGMLNKVLDSPISI